MKIELDKIFGHKNFRNEICWYYSNKLPTGGRLFDRHHDVILWYTKTDRYTFNEIRVETEYKGTQLVTKKVGGKRIPVVDEVTGKQLRVMSKDKPCGDTWRINLIHPQSRERIGYPTQKPEELMERIILASSGDNGVVADFYCGGGTTAAVAQRLGRRWIACDQSRVALAITADRLTRQVEEKTGKLYPIPDFTVEHWGIYEARRLAETPLDQYRSFVLSAFGAGAEEKLNGIHGWKAAIPVWVGDADRKKAVTGQDVQNFANAIRKTLQYKQDNLRDGIMLAWAFRPDAVEAADRLRRLEQTDLNFIRLEQLRIDSPRFREHVAALSTDHADYENFLTFVQPPRVEVGYKRIAPKTYKFDVSETVVMNAGGKIINVQWDFNYGTRFTSTQGFSFVRGGNKKPALQAQYEFPSSGKKRIACKVQDDMGGEGLWTAEIEVN